MEQHAEIFTGNNYRCIFLWLIALMHRFNCLHLLLRLTRRLRSFLSRVRRMTSQAICEEWSGTSDGSLVSMRMFSLAFTNFADAAVGNPADRVRQASNVFQRAEKPFLFQVAAFPAIPSSHPASML